MTEAAGAFAPQAAWATIQQASAYEVPLRRRLEGVTWMVWGIVTGAIFLSYDAIAPHFRAFDHATGIETHPPWYVDILWFYWVVAGALLTWALWRGAALAAGLKHRPAGLRVTMMWIAAGALGWAIVLVTLPNMHPHLTPLLALGITWLMLGVVNVQRATPTGRLVLVAVGFAMLIGGVVSIPLAPQRAHDLFAVNLARLLLATLAPFLGGLWQTLRG